MRATMWARLVVGFTVADRWVVVAAWASAIRVGSDQFFTMLVEYVTHGHFTVACRGGPHGIYHDVIVFTRLCLFGGWRCNVCCARDLTAPRAGNEMHQPHWRPRVNGAARVQCLRGISFI